ncbi:ADP-ribosyl-(dinitrogen reductase) hydrolase [Variovorax sp. RB2P76]|uniref:ADP-ribosyl-(dinitrogen reductase) hydrolase n=1 Tax=Variovorax sp. RB2P76 TaxID=3443736 RepID=UPI003F445867
MKNFIVSAAVLEKLRDKHQVSVREVEQCFENLCGMYVEDDREDNRTDPATLAFVAPTNEGRLLKVCFMFLEGNVHIKTAFEPTEEDVAFYDEHGR